MLRLKLRKKAFTLAETMIVCTIFVMIVVGIILGINRAFVFMNNTKLDVIATNLAREGVEMMYNIRDTNRRKHSGEKDKYWAYLGTGDNREYSRFNNGLYVLHEDTDTLGNMYIRPELIVHGYDHIHSNGGIFDYSSYDQYFDETIVKCYDDVDMFFSDKCNEIFESNIEDSSTRPVSIRDFAKIYFTGTYSYFSGENKMTGSVQEMIGSGNIEFYRILRVYEGIFKNKNTPFYMLGHEDFTQGIGDTEPKELHFCVKVFYRNSWGKHAKELCSVMTNFME